MKICFRKASILMEFVMVMPLLMVLITAIFQLALIWIAREMTFYAAYCGARAAVVYNPRDYGEFDSSGNFKFYSNKGVVHKAAVTVLAHINNGADNVAGADMAYLSGRGYDFHIPGWGDIVNSADTADRVSIVDGVTESVKREKDSADSGSWDFSLEDAVVSKKYRNLKKAVRITVSFKFPLLIPLAGRLLSDAAYFVSNGSDGYDTLSEKMKSMGYSSDMSPSDDRKGTIADKFYITLTESCLMAKPINTDIYPRIAEEDEDMFALNAD